MTKILITGASGMVGKHLVDMCLEKGCDFYGNCLQPRKHYTGARFFKKQESLPGTQYIGVRKKVHCSQQAQNRILNSSPWSHTPIDPVTTLFY